MTTSQNQSYFSEIAGNDPIPPEELAYFRARLKSRLYNFLVSRFLKEEANKRLTKAELARRIHKDPAQITRLLSNPNNLRLDTVSDLMLGICRAEVGPTEMPLFGGAERNYTQPEWLETFTNTISTSAPSLETDTSSTAVTMKSSIFVE